MTALELTSAWPSDRERIGVVEVEHRLAAGQRAAEIDAELLDDVALHLGDGDLEHDLVAAAHGDAVDHLVAVAGEPRGEIEGLLRLGRARGRAGQHDAVGEAFDPDVGVGQHALERRADAVEVARHRDVEAHRSARPSASKKNTLVWPTATPIR